MTTAPTGPGTGLSSLMSFITIMEYMLYRRKSICSKTIRLRYLTSWLYRDHQDLVRIINITQSTPLHSTPLVYKVLVAVYCNPHFTKLGSSLIVLMVGELSQHQPHHQIFTNSDQQIGSLLWTLDRYQVTQKLISNPFLWPYPGYPG